MVLVGGGGVDVPDHHCACVPLHRPNAKVII